MVFQNNVISGAAGSGTAVHTIDQSIRFNDDDSAQMSRTPSSSSTSQRAFSISMWVKRGNLTSGNRGIISWEGANDNNELRLYFDDDALIWSYYPASNVANITTNRLFRDTSAWYNILVVSDTENAVSSERWKMYINGQRETSFSSSTFPSQNTDIALFSSTSYATRIGKARSSSTSTFDGYLAEIVVIDGQALDPSSFGEVNDSGIWVPKSVSGLTFGTNGFHIDGRDSSDLGDDESGNGNDYTTSGLAAHDQVLDSPTNNFAVMNPNNNSGSGTLSQGNLRYAGASTGNNVAGTIGMSSDKWYWELYLEDDNQVFPGVQDSNVLANGYTEKAVGVETNDNGDIHEDDANSGYNSIEANTNGDIIGVAFDATNKKIWWSLNGVWYRANQSTTAVINISEVEAGNQGYDLSSRTPDFFMPFIGNYTHGTAIINFGQEGTFAGNTTAGGNSDGNGIGNFKYSVPSGYLALCTKNLGS